MKTQEKTVLTTRPDGLYAFVHSIIASLENVLKADISGCAEKTNPQFPWGSATMIVDCAGFLPAEPRMNSCHLRRFNGKGSKPVCFLQPRNSIQRQRLPVSGSTVAVAPCRANGRTGCLKGQYGLPCHIGFGGRSADRIPGEKTYLPSFRKTEPDSRNTAWEAQE